MNERKPAAEMMRLINGYQVSQAIHVAAALGIGDLLAGGPRTSDELAAATDSHPRSLYRLLRALASVEVLHETEGRRFALTPMGECLRSDVPDSLGPWAAFIGRPYYWQAWAGLAHSVRTGENAFRHVHGTDVWDYRAQHPDEGAIFDRAMSGMARGVVDAVIGAYDFAPFELVVDVGGGQGALLAAVLAAHPAARGILFDQPHVVARAEPVLRAAGVADRCRIEAGSFFEAVPEGGDAYILKMILHDWDDATAIAILERCRRAIKPDGKLVVLERVLGPANQDPGARFSDLNMLVSPGGQERTREEFAAILDAARFRLTAVLAAGTRISVVEAVPVQ